MKKQHHVKKSAVSDLSSCLSLGDDGKVAFLHMMVHTHCIESWDSDEDMYRVNQRSDRVLGFLEELPLKKIIVGSLQ